MDSVDFSLPRPFATGDDSDYQVSRNFTYLMRIVRNVAKMNRLYSRIHRRKDWISDPELAVMNPEISAWMHDLPADLNVNYPPDGCSGGELPSVCNPVVAVDTECDEDRLTSLAVRLS